MIFIRTLLLCALFGFSPNPALANDGSHPDDHAPLGVMGDHTHGTGEWMLSYRFMLMDMEGNRDGTDRVSPAKVLETFRVTPTDMTMEMHMFGAMFAPTDTLTLMLMLPFTHSEMNHLTRMGGRFTTESEGVGDLKATALVKVLERGHHQVHLNAGFGFPTGSIDEEDMTPMGRVRLPYPMQLGSGTYDLLSGVTYLGHSQSVSWGSQVLGTIRLGENDHDYTLGDRIEGSTWGAYTWCAWLSHSLRVSLERWADIDGADPLLDSTLVPTADPRLRAGTRLDLGLGMNLIVPEGRLKGHRLAIEWETPLYQRLDGPQLETDWSLTAGWQKAW